jgi:hypothetical protein
MAVQLSQLSRDWLSGDNLSDILDFRIDYVDVSIVVFEDIARNNIPNNISAIGVSALIVFFGKA